MKTMEVFGAVLVMAAFGALVWTDPVPMLTELFVGVLFLTTMIAACLVAKWVGMKVRVQNRPRVFAGHFVLASAFTAIGTLVTMFIMKPGLGASLETTLWVAAGGVGLSMLFVPIAGFVAGIDARWCQDNNEQALSLWAMKPPTDSVH